MVVCTLYYEDCTCNFKTSTGAVLPLIIFIVASPTFLYQENNFEQSTRYLKGNDSSNKMLIANDNCIVIDEEKFLN